LQVAEVAVAKRVVASEAEAQGDLEGRAQFFAEQFTFNVPQHTRARHPDARRAVAPRERQRLRARPICLRGRLRVARLAPVARLRGELVVLVSDGVDGGRTEALLAGQRR